MMSNQNYATYNGKQRHTKAGSLNLMIVFWQECFSPKYTVNLYLDPEESSYFPVLVVFLL